MRWRSLTPCTNSLILRSGPQDRVSKDAERNCN
jgi:hypothetical protein